LRTSVDEDRAIVHEALRHAYERKAEVVIVPSKNDVGVELVGFGGVVVILIQSIQQPPRELEVREQFTIKELTSQRIPQLPLNKPLITILISTVMTVFVDIGSMK
jgi:hypothetical protein